MKTRTGSIIHARSAGRGAWRWLIVMLHSSAFGASFQSKCFSHFFFSVWQISWWAHEVKMINKQIVVTGRRMEGIGTWGWVRSEMRMKGSRACALQRSAKRATLHESLDELMVCFSLSKILVEPKFYLGHQFFCKSISNRVEWQKEKYRRDKQTAALGDLARLCELCFADNVM